MFEINELVLYGMHGVCRVTDVVEQWQDDGMVKYYLLSPVFASGSKVQVPVDNETLTARMRPVLTREEAEELVDGMADQDIIWIDDPAQRRESYKNIILSGDRAQISALIKTLYNHRQEQKEKGKKLHLSDERYLKEAEKVLYSELAVAFDLRMDEVVGFLKKRVRK